MKDKLVVRNRNSRSRRVTRNFPHPDKVRTQQQFKTECDINHIVKNAMRGVPPRFLARGVPQFGDFTDVPNLADAYAIIRNAEEAFLNLPSELRLELGNDPARINELTKEQADKYGLLRAPRTPPSEFPPSPADPEPSTPPAKAGAEAGAPKGAPKQD